MGMGGLSREKILLISLIALSGLATYAVFDTYLIKVTIDYLSFAAGVFLVVEAAGKIRGSSSRPRYDLISRILRIMIGIWIFGTHLVQFISYRVLSDEIAEITIDYKDYFALVAGIFLIVDGSRKISASRSSVFPGQIPRALRVVIGACLVAIHILQFIHVYLS